MNFEQLMSDRTGVRVKGRSPKRYMFETERHMPTTQGGAAWARFHEEFAN